MKIQLSRERAELTGMGTLHDLALQQGLRLPPRHSARHPDQRHRATRPRERPPYLGQQPNDLSLSLSLSLIHRAPPSHLSTFVGPKSCGPHTNKYEKKGLSIPLPANFVPGARATHGSTQGRRRRATTRADDCLQWSQGRVIDSSTFICRASRRSPRERDRACGGTPYPLVRRAPRDRRR